VGSEGRVVAAGQEPAGLRFVGGADRGSIAQCDRRRLVVGTLAEADPGAVGDESTGDGRSAAVTDIKCRRP